jgi:hypothetical protein
LDAPTRATKGGVVLARKVTSLNNEYKKGFVEGYEAASKKYNKLTMCKDCKYFSKLKLKCYKPYANRHVNAGDFCSRGVRYD